MSRVGTVSPAELVGTEFEPHDVLVDTGLLQLFTKVVGLSDPRHHDPDAALAAGQPGLLVPPTYLFSLERRHPDVPRILGRLGVPVGSVLHGEQTFRYHTPCHSGERLTFRPRIANYYEKKGGALRFLVRDSAVTRGGTPVADLRNVLVIR